MDSKAAVRPVAGNRKKQRNSSLDIIRIAAFLMVFFTHFFLYSGFYEIDMVGAQAFFMSVVRCFGISCIPLYLFLSGYLMKEKELNSKYYSGIKRVLLTYFFASGLCYLYDCYADEEAPEIYGFFKGLLGFRSADYSWYVEMYIGLFLLIPFLNIIWNNLQNKKQRIILIVTFAFLTLVPQNLNVFVFNVENWWQQPSLSNDFMHIFPKWWAIIYPITYYFIGCYIREYGIKINKWLNVALIIVTALAFGGYCYYRSTPGKFLKGTWQTNTSVFVVLLGVLIFALILNADIKIRSPFLRSFCTKIAGLSLGAYIVSCVSDEMLYTHIKTSMDITQLNFSYILITAPLSLLISLFFAFIINLLTKLILNTSSLISGALSRLLSPAKNKEPEKSPEARRPVKPSGTSQRPRPQQPARPRQQTGAAAQHRSARPVPRNDSNAYMKAEAPVPEGQYKKHDSSFDGAEEVINVVEDDDLNVPYRWV